MLFSIIIPHHNIPGLLQRCLDSIPQRDDLEVIVVDDNSDPAVVNFDNFPGKDRPDVKILRNDKRWAGTARNKGIEAATGRWLIFADADDYFNYCFNAMLDKYADSEADIVYFQANSLDCEYYSYSSRGGAFDYCVGTFLNGEPQGEALIRYGFPWVLARLIRRELVTKNNILFDEEPTNEEVCFSYMSGHLARTVTADPHCIYCLTYRLGSLDQQTSDEQLLAKVRIFAKRELFLRVHTSYEPICWHYWAWVKLVFRGSPYRKQAKETLKSYGLLGFRAYAWFAYFSSKLIMSKLFRMR